MLFTLIIHGLLWYLSNRQATQGGFFINVTSFLSIIHILNNLIRVSNFNVPACDVRPGYPYCTIPIDPQLNKTWPCPPLSSHLKPNIYPRLPNWWEFLMGSWLNLWGSSPASRVSSCTKIRIYGYLPMRPP